jgi:predicted DNA-binding ArsR family transcriptional regulator
VLGVTFTMLKSLVKRSTKLDYRGHRIERVKE